MILLDIYPSPDVNVQFIKSIFVRYILMPLILLILFFVLGRIRKFKPEIKFKTIIIYVLLAGLTLSILGFLGFSGNLFNPYWYLISQIIYLGLGIFHVNLLHKFFRGSLNSFFITVAFELVLTLACVVLGAFLYIQIFRFISDGLGNPYMSSTTMFSFFVPLIYYYTYVQFINIPFNIYKTWRYDPDLNIKKFEVVDYDKLVVVNLDLSKKVENDKRHIIKAKSLPRGITFTEWFSKAVDDYNSKNPSSPIELYDSVNEPFYWIFYIKKSFFTPRKYIDFEKDFSENKIEENDVIICKRVINHEEKTIK